MKYGVLFWKRGKWDNCAKLSLMTLTKGKQDVDSGGCSSFPPSPVSYEPCLYIFTPSHSVYPVIATPPTPTHHPVSPLPLSASQ